MLAALARRSGLCGYAATAAGLSASAVVLASHADTPSSVTHCEQLIQQSSDAPPRLFCWGRLAPASAGDNSSVRIRERAPVDVTFWSSQGLQIKEVCYGGTHAAVLDTSGGLWAWGEHTGPKPIRLQCRAALMSLASTQNSLYAVTSSGRVLEWRDLDRALTEGTLPPPEPTPLQGALSGVQAAQVAAGDEHILVIGRRGEVVAMGDNTRGQLGLADPAALPRCDKPTALQPLRAPAAAAACGGAHSVVCLTDGSVVAFGDDRNLQLGLRRCTNMKEMREGRTSVHTPQPVLALRDLRVVGVAAGGGGLDGGHTVFHVRGEEGDGLWACGHGRWGQLGGKAYTHISDPKLVTTIAKLREWDESTKRVVSVRIDAIGCGERHTACLLSTGNAFVWGWNDQGQLGTGNSQGSHTPSMVKSPPELRFAKLRGLTSGPNSVAVWS